ncbi:hypothetical protein VHUM_02868 [Vanrija humicola]|uniref:Uncharacterized protein n=1 Tax=Vanrija humicola TaxID=5417 RepID=A0A7D8YYV2_VANHU|nr:hypothetical protein VHUM_02868 [Vanrija humicola]
MCGRRSLPSRPLARLSARRSASCRRSFSPSTLRPRRH